MITRLLNATLLFLLATTSVTGNVYSENSDPEVGSEPPLTDPAPLFQVQQENAELREQHTRDLNRTHRYQYLTLAGMLIAIGLALVLYRSRSRLRQTNQQLKQQIEANNRDKQARRELTQRVSQAERMESLGALAGGIAHDFNNLLVGIVCNAEVLQLYHEPTAEADKCLNGILKAAETASDLSRKMRAYAGQQPSEKCPTDVNKLVRPMVSLAQSGLIGAEVTFNPSAKPAVANVDGTQIEQIVLNLVNNANEAIDGTRGTIRIAIEHERVAQSGSDPHLLGVAVTDGNYVVIEVADNGPGIDLPDVSRIFEPFQSSHSGCGRGLGLSVVYGHVRRHDGLIRVDSRPGEGTTIRIMLPASTHSVVPEPAEPVADTLSPAGVLLLVDDQEMIRDVASRFMNQVQWEVVECAGGAEALEWLKQNAHNKPDCICLDIVMPETDGVKVLQRLQELRYGVPVIVTSGYSQANEEAEFAEYDCVAEFLPKPFNTQQLVSAVSRATSGRPRATSPAASSPK